MKLSKLFCKMTFTFLSLSFAANVGHAKQRTTETTVLNGKPGYHELLLTPTGLIDTRLPQVVYQFFCYLSYRVNGSNKIEMNDMTVRLQAVGNRDGFIAGFALPANSVSVYRSINLKYNAPSRGVRSLLPGGDREEMRVSFVSDASWIETTTSPLTKRDIAYLGRTTISGHGFVLNHEGELQIDCAKEF